MIRTLCKIQKGRPGLCDDFHFKLIDLNDSTWNPLCLNCTNRKSVHTGSIKPMVTSNLNRHLKTKHPEMYKIYLMKKDGREKEIVKNSVDKLCATHEEFSKSILNFVFSDEQPISDL